MGEANTLAPMASPELPPATSCAAVLSSSPACLSVSRGPLVSSRAQAGAQRGPRRCLGRASALRGPPFLRAGPTVAVIVFLFVLFLLFHRLVYRFKNVYILVGRCKCYGSNFVEFMIMCSI